MTLTDVMLVVSNSCTLIIKPKGKTDLKSTHLCYPKDIPVELLDYVVDTITPLDKNLLLVTIWK